jgi:uncharacterized SAM-binding protein YcdF (DUF218 family)
VAISGGNTAARTASAIDLYKKGWADKLIFSGAAADKNSPSNAKTMQQQAVAAGVPIDAILLDETSANTAENARNVAKILQQNGFKEVILTTSAYHMRRSALLFNHYIASGGRVRTSPAVDDGWQWWFLTPRGWWQIMTELSGIIAYYTGINR